jgi:hypothetical protein
MHPGKGCVSAAILSQNVIISQGTNVMFSSLQTSHISAPQSRMRG